MSYNQKCKYFSMEYVGNPGPVPVCNKREVLEVFDCTYCKDNLDNEKKTDAKANELNKDQVDLVTKALSFYQSAAGEFEGFDQYMELSIEISEIMKKLKGE